MQYNINQLLEEFEIEMWLYVDEALPEKRIKFWDEQINRHPELKQMLNDTLETLSLYDNAVEYELSDSAYNEMVAKAAVNKTNIWSGVKNKIDTLLFASVNTHRVAFGAAIIILFVVITSVIKNPDADIDTTLLLDWRGEDLTTKLSEMDNSIHTIKKEEQVEYRMYKFTKDKFDVAVESIEDRIDELKNSINNETL